MYSIGVKALKNQLSHYLRLAAEGQRILITDRNRVVAELRAPESHTPVAVGDALLADSVRNGYVRPALVSLGRPQSVPHEKKIEDILSDLDEDRTER